MAGTVDPETFAAAVEEYFGFLADLAGLGPAQDVKEIARSSKHLGRVLASHTAALEKLPSLDGKAEVSGSVARADSTSVSLDVTEL